MPLIKATEEKGKTGKVIWPPELLEIRFWGNTMGTMMKQFVLLWIIIIITISLGTCQTNIHNRPDTLSYMSLTDGQGVNYVFVQMVDVL